MLHTFLNRLFDQWRANLTMQSDMRERAGFDGLPTSTCCGEQDVFHVNTLAAFDTGAPTGWNNVVHGAPVLTVEVAPLKWRCRGRRMMRHRWCW